MYHLEHDRPIVQKYGGTSVGSLERIDEVAKRVADQYHSGIKKIAIVVSAMSGETNRLVDLINGTNPRASARNYDMVVAAGEQVSVALMSAALEKHGIPSKAFLGYQLGIVTDNFHSKARIQKIECAKLHKCWEEDAIPVVAGFQGVTGDLEITTLGRGGSDTSAVALAVALDAAFCEINTDVDGVFTADPRIVPDARLVKEMDFEVALEMASLGSKVLHSRCVELGAKYHMPIVVRNTFKPNDHARTFIMNFSNERKLEAPIVSGVTLDRNVVRLSLHNLPARGGIIGAAFQLIAENGVNVDIIVHNRSNDSDRMRVGFTIGSADLLRTKELLERWVIEKKLGAYVEVEEGLSKVSVVGLGMQSHPGVASRVFSVLEDAGIALHMISTSEIKISCVISEKEGESAARALHKEFVLPDVEA
jgi:aspartate kinase